MTSFAGTCPGFFDKLLAESADSPWNRMRWLAPGSAESNNEIAASGLTFRAEDKELNLLQGAAARIGLISTRQVVVKRNDASVAKFDVEPTETLLGAFSDEERNRVAVVTIQPKSTWGSNGLVYRVHMIGMNSQSLVDYGYEPVVHTLLLERLVSKAGNDYSVKRMGYNYYGDLFLKLEQGDDIVFSQVEIQNTIVRTGP